jgi:hypothetical protein
MVLDDLASHLQTVGVAVISSSLFKGTIPLDGPGLPVIDRIMVITIVPGLPPVRVHNQRENAYEQPVVQVLTRGDPYDFQEAALRAHAAFVALDGLTNIALSGTRYLWILAMQSPFYLRTDENKRPMIVFNVRCAKEW